MPGSPCGEAGHMSGRGMQRVGWRQHVRAELERRERSGRGLRGLLERPPPTGCPLHQHAEGDGGREPGAAGQRFQAGRRIGHQRRGQLWHIVRSTQSPWRRPALQSASSPVRRAGTQPQQLQFLSPEALGSGAGVDPGPAWHKPPPGGGGAELPACTSCCPWHAPFVCPAGASFLAGAGAGGLGQHPSRGGRWRLRPLCLWRWRQQQQKYLLLTSRRVAGYHLVGHMGGGA
ncbi:uncharacterized protein LOC128329062 isoform X8 [Hemicordylus capensis]|uniref:uncharacterized protein LOC128329062 isoform X8 n=1 Tax=Hemicordylus capensis TaxID=884348 RepID=UPI002304A365|nr:uncharacterized protein LOC128329062 isoform X8 [Hemicordylus capensis]